MEWIVSSFSPELWSTLVERVIVNGTEDLVYRLWDGREVESGMMVEEAVDAAADVMEEAVEAAE